VPGRYPDVVINFSMLLYDVCWRETFPVSMFVCLCMVEVKSMLGVLPVA
jgi:hypothetical protein